MPLFDEIISKISLAKTIQTTELQRIKFTKKIFKKVNN